MNYLDKFIVCFLAILVIGLSSAKITAGKEGSEKTSTTTENILSGSDSTNWLYNQPKDIASKSENLGYYFTIATCFIFITPVILLILRADFFDNGEFMLIAGCLQCRCYACGITRGIIHLIHLEREKAAEYHMLSFVVLPLLIIVWCNGFLTD